MTRRELIHALLDGPMHSEVYVLTAGGGRVSITGLDCELWDSGRPVTPRSYLILAAPVAPVASGADLQGLIDRYALAESVARSTPCERSG